MIPPVAGDALRHFTPAQTSRMRSQKLKMDAAVMAYREGFADLHPRANQPWSLAEDGRLRKLVAAAQLKWKGDAFKGYGSKAVHHVAKALGRTPSAIRARWAILRVVDAHRAAERRKIALRRSPR